VIIRDGTDRIGAFETHTPNLLASVRRTLNDVIAYLGFWRLDPKGWATCENISIDKAP
jgi:hypothetical protein